MSDWISAFVLLPNPFCFQTYCAHLYPELDGKTVDILDVILSLEPVLCQRFVFCFTSGKYAAAMPGDNFNLDGRGQCRSAVPVHPMLIPSTLASDRM